MAAIAPDLNIPESSSTVDVSIINATGSVKGLHTWSFFSPSVPGHEYIAVPTFAFLIQHPSLDRSLVFDLGIRKDWQNSSPFLVDAIKDGGFEVTVTKSVRQILEENAVDASKLEAVVWSHWHFDHTGDPSEFEKSTALIVGSGFKDHMLPGYPANPKSPLLETDYSGRELIELQMSSDLKIGKLKALDYFGDGSFYFMESPGHAVGHVSALARVTTNPSSFVLMGGDAWHHGGELRPSPFLPLPATIEPHPFAPLTLSSCPGSLFEPILRDNDPTKPVYIPSVGTKFPSHYDAEAATRTIEKLQEADVCENILMVAAHDGSLLDILDFFPKSANDFMAKGWVKKARWRFLADFAQAVGYEGDVEGKREWAAFKEAPTSV